MLLEFREFGVDVFAVVQGLGNDLAEDGDSALLDEVDG